MLACLEEEGQARVPVRHMEVSLGSAPVLSLHQFHDHAAKGCEGAVDADGLLEVLPSSATGLVPLTACSMKLQSEA